MAEWIEAGAEAPAFNLPDSDGEKMSLSALRGKPVVLYFYPRDDTPGCTREACSFRDRKKDLAKLGAAVLGVSTDTVESHAKFRDKYGLNRTCPPETAVSANCVRVCAKPANPRIHPKPAKTWAFLGLRVY
ncbi:MAG: peroxiredoxin [Thermoguttaceae bacterium]|jgi:peroxiredoxin|nr:peroxiredoxin [Thermoguttaceae bacterium]